MRNAAWIAEDVEGLTEEGFAADRRRRDAVERCVERVCEAAVHLGARAEALMLAGFSVFGDSASTHPAPGAHPAAPNLWLSCGQGALGFTLAMGCAQVVADLIAGRAPRIPLDGFLQRH